MKVFLIVCLHCVLVSCGGDKISEEDDLAQSEWEDEVKAFEQFEEKAVSFMKTVRIRALPFLVKAAIQITLSEPCSSSLAKLYTDIQTLKSWALRMLDSSGKLPGGVLRGTMMMLGEYEECINIIERDEEAAGKEIKGKYCLTSLYGPKMFLYHLQKYSAGGIRNITSLERFKDLLNMMSKYKLNATAMHFRVGICIPSTCSENDLYNMLDYGMKKAGIRSQILRCEEKTELQIETHQIPIIVAFGIVAVAVILGSFADCCYNITSVSRKNAILHFLHYFSVSRNARYLFKDRQKNSEVACLRGLIVLIFVFMTIAQSYVFFDQHWFFNFRSSMNYFDFIKDPMFAIIANSAFVVETFFCVAGFLLYYTPVHIAGINIKSLIIRICSRSLFPLLIAIAVFLLLPLLGNGPVWHEVIDGPLAACRENWWWNLLFINNFLKMNDQCLVQTSFIACMAQLLVVGILFKYIINRWPKFGVTFLLLIVAVCNAFTGLVTVTKALPPSLSSYFILKRTLLKGILENYFFLPHGHMGSFAVGILVGYRMRTNPEEKPKRMTSLLLWACMLILWCLLVFGLYPYHDGSRMNIIALVLYSSLHCTTFGVVIGMGIFVCIKGHGGFVGNMLSSKFFILPRNLFYPAYLLHSTVTLFYIGISRERMYYSHYEMVSKSFGYLSIIFLAAFIFQVFFGGLFSFIDSLAPPNSQEIPEQSKSHSMVKSSNCLGVCFKSRKFRVKPSSIGAYDITKETSFPTSIYSVAK